MLGKKTLGVIMSLSLLASVVSPAISVQADAGVSVSKYNEKVAGPRYVPANIEAIIEGLKEKGIIPANATEGEIQKILKNYLNTKEYNGELSKKQRDIKSKQLEKLEGFKFKEYSGNKEDIQYSKGEIPKIQKEAWNEKPKKVKTLVIPIDFKDYKYTDYATREKDRNLYKSYEPEHYKTMMFNDETFKGPNGQDLITVKKYYREQSGESYIMDGEVTKWYTAKHEAKYYGEEKNGQHDINPQELIIEAVQAAAKDIDLSEFDVENVLTGEEGPDGIIDHIIVVHAGKGQEEFGGTLGDDAIWAHSFDLREPFAVKYKNKAGEEKEIKAFNYTIQPQNGGVGVFSHEYGHDMGLPDEYNQGGGIGEPVGNWSIMSGGSWGGFVPGTEPTGFSPSCREFFQATYGGNWLIGEEIHADKINEQGIDITLDQASEKGKNLDVFKIELPDKVTRIVNPTSGKSVYFGGKGTDGHSIKNNMSVKVDLKEAKNAKLKFKTNYDIEEGWDFASIQVKEEGTEVWKAIKGNITTDQRDPKASIIVEHGITGSTNGQWKDAEFDLSEYNNKNIELKFEYETDKYSFGTGFYVDDINIEANGNAILSDDAEKESKFKLSGFEQNDGCIRTKHYYLLEWRNHHGVDKGLANYYGCSYDPGLVVWYVDNYYGVSKGADNNTNIHPGYGFVGVVDADQNPVLLSDNKIDDIAGNQIHDAAFGLRKGNSKKLNDVNTFMHPIFDDSKDYSNKAIPEVGRILNKYGLKIYVTGESKDRSVGRIHISRTTK